MDNDLPPNVEETTLQNLRARLDAGCEDLATGNERPLGLVLAEINSRLSVRIEYFEVEHIDGNRWDSSLVLGDRPGVRPGLRSVSQHCSQLLTSNLTIWLIVLVASLPIAAAAQTEATNFDARVLNQGEVTTFAQLACTGTISQGQNSYQMECGGLSGYAGNESGPFGLSFSSVLYGHLTDVNSIQAYVSYTGDFEPHSNNYGGGILFSFGPGGWSLVDWFPSLIMDSCLQLNPNGLAKMLCSGSYSGMGEHDTLLTLNTIPPAPNSDNDYSAYIKHVLSGQDESQQVGDAQNYDCGLVKTPAQRMLIRVEDLARSDKPGFVAMARLSFVQPSDIATYCVKHDLEDAPITEENIRFSWNGNALGMFPSYDFAPTD